MEFGELKPVAAALVLPPAGPLLLVLLGLVLAVRRRAAGWLLAFAGAAGLWFLSCHAVAVMLAESVLPQVRPITAAEARSVQAIVVLGAGIDPQAPEYGSPQPNLQMLGRLRYGALLSRQYGKPLGFAGGVGWAAAGTPSAPEGATVRGALQEWGVTPRWVDERSRDTQENARQMAALLARDGVRRIALVTHAWHMPRSVAHFRAAGLDVVPAPTLFPGWRERPLLEWLPSGEGLYLSRTVLREWLGAMAQRD